MFSRLEVKLLQLMLHFQDMGCSLNDKHHTLNIFFSCLCNFLYQSYNFSTKSQNEKVKLSSQQFYVQAAPQYAVSV